MRIRLQALLRGTAIAAVMAAVISLSPGAARADEMGDLVKSNVLAALAESGVSGTQMQTVLNALNSSTDGTALVNTLSNLNLGTAAAIAVGKGLGVTANNLQNSNPTGAGFIQQAAGSNTFLAVGFSQTSTVSAFGGGAFFGGGGGGGFGLGNSGGGFGGGGGNPFSLLKIGPYQT